MLTWAVVGLTIAVGGVAGLGGERNLQQAQTPGFDNLERPLSATPDDLLWDPAGRAHLLVSPTSTTCLPVMALSCQPAGVLGIHLLGVWA